MTGEPRRTPPRDIDLDAFDGALIRALQEDGRASIHELAVQLDASRDFVSQRLRTLTEHHGVRVVAALDPGFVGHHILIHGMVSVDGRAEPVARALAELPDAVFVSMITGPFPLVFESRHSSVAELHDALDQVRRIPGMRRVQVTTYAEVLRGFFVARQRTELSLDALDYEIITLLQGDGRMSYRAVGDAVHLSAGSARNRVHRLMDAGVIHISALKSGGVSRNRIAVGIGITVSGDAEPVRRYIVQSPVVDFAAVSHGHYDVVATLVGPSTGTLLAVMEELRALPQVSSLESWAHLNIVKEDYASTLRRVVLE